MAANAAAAGTNGATVRVKTVWRGVSRSRRGRRRYRLLLAVFALWAAVALARAYSLAVVAHEERTGVGEQLARSEYALPAPRGRLLDRDGVPLVWSERYFDLYLNFSDAAPTPAEWDELRRILGPRCPDFSAAVAGQALLRHLTPGEVAALKPLAMTGGPFAVRSRLERIVAVVPALRRQAGEVELQDGALVGVSGWELDYEAVLRGRPGKFSVMLDRYRHWIPSSWKLLREPVPGRDVRLPVALAELAENGGRL